MCLRRHLRKLLSSLFGVMAVVLVALAGYLQPEPSTPEEFKAGLHPRSAEIGAEIAKERPRFRVFGAIDHSRERCCLWDSILPLDLPGKPAGRHFPNPRQEFQDCAGFAGCNCIRYTLGFQISLGDPVAFHDPYPPWPYGVSRQTIGQNALGNEPGAVIAWVLQGFQEKGILCADDPGVPPYQGSVSELWGRRPGPPQQFFEIAQARKLGGFSKLETVDDVVEALGNFYAVEIGDSFFAPPQCRVVDGRQVAEWSVPVLGGHAMAIVGYDGTVPGKQYFYVLNSHGENDVPQPLMGEPPGGFWITRDKLVAILRGRQTRRGPMPGEAWALSGGVDGFPARELRSFDLFGARRARTNTKEMAL